MYSLLKKDCMCPLKTLNSISAQSIMKAQFQALYIRGFLMNYARREIFTMYLENGPHS